MRSDVFDYSMVSTTLIGGTCPICSKKLVIEREKDYTPGFKYTCFSLKTQSCDCNIKVDYSNGEVKGE